MDFTTNRPILYIVKPAPGHQAGIEAARFLSFTPISRVISSLSPLAISTARTIVDSVNVPYAERDAALGGNLTAIEKYAELAKILPHPLVLVTEIAESEPGDIITVVLAPEGNTEFRYM